MCDFFSISCYSTSIRMIRSVENETETICACRVCILFVWISAVTTFECTNRSNYNGSTKGSMKIDTSFGSHFLWPHLSMAMLICMKFIHASDMDLDKCHGNHIKLLIFDALVIFIFDVASCLVRRKR